jgi:hypothetical protein
MDLDSQSGNRQATPTPTAPPKLKKDEKPMMEVLIVIQPGRAMLFLGGGIHTKVGICSYFETLQWLSYILIWAATKNE